MARLTIGQFIDKERRAAKAATRAKGNRGSQDRARRRAYAIKSSVAKKNRRV